MKTDQSSSIEELLRQAAVTLAVGSQTARLDAELLLGFLLGYSRLQLLINSTNQVDQPVQQRFQELILRRLKHEPIAYLVGEKEFYGLEFKVSPAVLVPRPETELLVERAIDFAMTLSATTTVLDLGSGSGCISVALAHTLRERGKQVQVVAIDKSQEALALAQENALRHGVLHDIEFRLGDWFAGIDRGQRFDLILANPPYIAPDDSQISPELQYEPASALFAGENGMSDISAILKGIEQLEQLPGLVLIETGFSQGANIKVALMEGRYGQRFQGARVEVVKDLAGLSRFISIRSF